MACGINQSTLRAAVESIFDRTVTRERVTRVDDGAGGWTEVVTTTTYPGFVSARNVIPREAVQGGRLTATTVYMVRLPGTADVLPPDRLLVDGQRLQVTDTDGLKSQKLQLIVSCYLVT